jgi:hypothetical protein
VERCSSVAGSTRPAVAATQAASIAGIHRFARWPRAGMNSRPRRMDWASVESPTERLPLESPKEYSPHPVDGTNSRSGLSRARASERGCS